MQKPQLVRAMSSLNVPAFAAAHVIKSHVAQGPDELSLEVSSSRRSVLSCIEEGSPFCFVFLPDLLNLGLMFQSLSGRRSGEHC